MLAHWRKAFPVKKLIFHDIEVDSLTHGISGERKRLFLFNLFYIQILDTFKCHSWLFQDKMRSLVPFSMLSVHSSCLSDSAALTFSHHILFIIVSAITLLQHIHWFDIKTINNNHFFGLYGSSKQITSDSTVREKRGVWVLKWCIWIALTRIFASAVHTRFKHN